MTEEGADEGRRVASSMYEENFLPKDSSFTKLKEPPLNIVRLNNNLYRPSNENLKSVDEWIDLFDKAAFFKGYDIILGEVVIMIYEDPDSLKISSVLFSCLGEFHFNGFTLDNKSRFFDACKNLDKSVRKSNTRRALAITLLKTYALMEPNEVKMALNNNIPFEWDETVAGELASSMKLISSKSPAQIGQCLLNLGFLQPHFIESTLLDVIYDDNPSVIDSNNKLVYLIGQQLEQLFDPLTEYSPESTNILYRPPERPIKFNDDKLVQDICQELLQLQENTTTQLVKFLREAVVPIRMKTLNGEIKGLTTSQLNQVFPPTIDEVTRVNCIFLEALKNSIEHGSFEVMKACGSTIPYFYKATMRHESALKSFDGNLKQFLEIYGRYIPNEYSEAHIDVILKSQLNLTKIKMILERLVKTKNWSSSEKIIVDQNFKSATETIDSFGKEELKPYNKRVFTPSGKVLTEICENWPAILSYGWVNRKVVSVIDTVNQNNKDKGLIVLFSDYIIFLSIIDDEDEDSLTSKPQVSDILMNSLINENPIQNIPRMKVTAWSLLNDLEISTFSDNSITFLFKNGQCSAGVFEIDDTSKFIRVFNKSLILSKTTPFHLFQIERFGFNIFVTAHERSTYITEKSHSKIALFLNIEPNKNLLKENKVEFGLFAKFIEDDLIKIHTLTISKNPYSNTINSSEFSSYLSEEISNLETKRHSIESKNYFDICTSGTQSLLLAAISKPIMKPQSQQVSRKSSTRKSLTSNFELFSKASTTDRIASYSSVKNTNEEAKINTTKKEANTTSTPKLSKKSKLKQRLSKLFNLSDKPLPVPPKEPAVKRPIKKSNIANLIIPQKSNDSIPSIKEKCNAIFDTEVPEISSFDDVKTFETTMSALFDEDLDYNNNIEILDDLPNWVLKREKSSVQVGLNEIKNKNISGVEAVDEEDDTNNDYDITYNMPITSEIEHVLIKPEAKPIIYKVNTKPVRTIFNNFQQTRLESPRKVSSKEEPGVLSTFSSISMDEGFQSPLLKVGIESQEDINNKDYDAYYTPMSSNAGFQDYGSMNPSDSLLDFEFDSFDTERVINLTKKSEDCYSTATSFKSCFDNEDIIRQLPSTSRIYDDENDLSGDDSFQYLAKFVEGSFNVDNFKKSETYQTLPRSYSSLKYLASYIDTSFPIDT